MVDMLVLVNRDTPLPEGWEQEMDIVRETNTLGQSVPAERAAWEAYRRLREALAREGVFIELDSGWRSVAEQRDIMERFTEKYGAEYARNYVAVPGFSEHHTGLALDLYYRKNGRDIVENEDLEQDPETWAAIHDKLAAFGFILRYPEGKEAVTGYSYEPWHIRYVGEKAAGEIAARGITLEEYLGKTPGK